MSFITKRDIEITVVKIYFELTVRKTLDSILFSLDLTDNGRTKPHPKTKKGKKAATSSPRKAMSPEHDENLCLLRASNGKKHISTVVSAKEVTRFQLVSSTTCS